MWVVWDRRAKSVEKKHSDVRQRPSFSAHRAAPMTKTDLIFPAFSSRSVDFAVQFCFRCKFYSVRSDAGVRFDSGAIFLDQSQFFATHSNQWNCFILKRSKITSNGIFSCKGGAKAGPKCGFRVMLKYFEIKKAFRYYIKQIDSMLPCVWFSNRSQKTLKCGKNISDTLGYASCATFLFLPHFDVICDLLLNRRTATWNLFVKCKQILMAGTRGYIWF